MSLVEEGGAGEDSGDGAFFGVRSESGRERGILPSEGWFGVEGGGGRRSVSVRGGSDVDEATFPGGGGCFGLGSCLFRDEGSLFGPVEKTSERERRHGDVMGGEKSSSLEGRREEEEVEMGRRR